MTQEELIGKLQGMPLIIALLLFREIYLYRCATLHLNGFFCSKQKIIRDMQRHGARALVPFIRTTHPGNVFSLLNDNDYKAVLQLL